MNEYSTEVRLPVSVDQRVRYIASKAGQSRSQIIREALMAFLTTPIATVEDVHHFHLKLFSGEEKLLRKVSSKTGRSQNELVIMALDNLFEGMDDDLPTLRRIETK